MNNKKLLSFVLSAAMAATSIFPATVYAAVSGDINGDGAITSADLDILQGYVLGKHDITQEQFKVADINADQVVDVYDVTALRKKILATDRTLSFKSVTDRMNDGITDALKKLDLQAGGTVVKSTAELKTALSPYFSETVVNNYLKKYDDNFFKESVLLVKPAYFDPAKFTKNGTLTKISCGCDNSYAGLYTTGPTVDQGLNIRKEHTAGSAALGLIPPGAKFNITYANGTKDGNFGHVTYNGVSGYVNMGYVTKLSSTAPTYVAVPDIKVDSVKYSKGTVTVSATEYNASSNVSFAAAVLAQAVVPKKDYYASKAQWTVTTTSTTTTTTTTTTCAYPLAKARMDQKNIKTLKEAFVDCSSSDTVTYVEWEKDASKISLTKAADYGFNTRNGKPEAKAQGNCYVLAAMFCEMARLLGYDAHLINGRCPLRAGGYGPHGWVEIIENGTAYVYDPDYTLESKGDNGFRLTYGHTVWPIQKISEIK
ncbi:MAG: hypothetical protein K5898_02505 [Ruminococcus sp.]|uniref:dockerin type I domain-containing protein n=1 Tax=Ruminococcus sp. TaxID=41978 RepID=UPI0025D70082|nr:dockerin type I domain-containing protein [Ruminococcus sp.]MCR4794039.1 hypothetical protein [Ruminococcus sp.]